MAPSLIIYGGKNCHLCEVAKAAADRVLPRYGLTYWYVNIREDAELSSRYDQMIPVIAAPAAESPENAGPAASIGLAESPGGGAGGHVDVKILLFGNIDDSRLEAALEDYGFRLVDGETA